MSTHAKLDELQAYADGELQSARVAEIEQLLADDPEARVLVRDLQEGNGLLRAAFNEPLHDPLPVAVSETVEREFAARRRPRASGGNRWGAWAPAAIAASLALIVGLTAAYLISERQVEQALARLESRDQADRLALDAAVNQGLEQNVSGIPLDWHNPDTGSRGEVTPIRTFKSTAGQWCREYEATLVVDDQNQVRRAIACREQNGQWRTRVALAQES